jgi:acetyl/propionyl-CoA carboxylase alpha subunit
MIFVPFLTWYLTWFGRPLTDSQVEEYLNDKEKPRHVQHALSQIAERITRGDQSVKKWYPTIVALASHSLAEIRVTAAWMMGQDNQSQEFHDALNRLLADSDPMVRRNAALGLVRFEDANGRREIMAMLKPHIISSPDDGLISASLEIADPATVGTAVVSLRRDDGQETKVRAPVPGRVDRIMAGTGSRVVKGQELATLAPDGQQVFEALRALYLVGQPEDLAEVERYAGGVPDMPEAVQQQAQLTAKTIRSRTNQR